MVYELPVVFRGHIIDSTGKLTSDFSQYHLLTTTVMRGEYYGFQQQDSVFSNLLVRKAFSRAIDRRKIVNNVLKSGGNAGLHGVVPPVFTLYPSLQIEGNDFDPAAGRRLLTEAGYPMGKNFPTVTLFIEKDNEEQSDVAKAVQNMLFQNLNVRIRIQEEPAELYAAKIAHGYLPFYSFSWQADFPDPESFLNIFYSKNLTGNDTEANYLDHFRYKNPAFDSLFQAALYTRDELQRMKYMAKAGEQVMNDAVVIVLYYPVDYIIMQPYIRQFKINPMQLRDFTDVYFDKNAMDSNKRKK
jgi:peptide/nickel transport system substrate-binding protein